MAGTDQMLVRAPSRHDLLPSVLRILPSTPRRRLALDACPVPNAPRYSRLGPETWAHVHGLLLSSPYLHCCPTLQLLQIGALTLDGREGLTPLGAVLSLLPVDPAVGKLLVLSAVFGLAGGWMAA